MSEDEDKVNPDERISIRASDKRVAPNNEYSDSEDEGDDRKDEKSFRPKKKKHEDISASSMADDKSGMVEPKEEKPSIADSQSVS